MVVLLSCMYWLGALHFFWRYPFEKGVRKAVAGTLGAILIGTGEEGRFRGDLYYRLSVFPVELPALRERREDIPPLARYFLDRHSARAGKSVGCITAEALEALGRYSWPGNVRELENEIERSLVLASAGSRIGLAELSEKVRGSGGRRLPAPQSGLGLRTAAEAWTPGPLRDHAG